jgi:hypothetical protein
MEKEKKSHDSAKVQADIELKRLRNRYTNQVREDPAVLGEARYVPYYVDLLESNATFEVKGENWYVFEVTAYDRSLFPELKDVGTLHLRYDPDIEAYSMERFV